MIAILEDPLIHKPGGEFLYSTYGFVLLSAVLEKVMGKPFHEAARDYIRQMGLVQTRAEPTPKSREIVSGRIQGYSFILTNVYYKCRNVNALCA